MKPKIIAVANYKGGVGKSTIAFHMAAHLDAALVDLDVNGDAARLGDACHLEAHHMNKATAEQLYVLAEGIKKGGKSVILDCPPGESELTNLSVLLADAVICPTRPGPLDTYGLGRIIQVVREARASRQEKVPLLFLCNFYRNTDIARLICETLKMSDAGTFIGKLWERVEYADAVADGKAVWDAAPRSTGAVEMKNLVSFLEKAVDRGKA